MALQRHSTVPQKISFNLILMNKEGDKTISCNRLREMIAIRQSGRKDNFPRNIEPVENSNAKRRVLGD